MDIIEKCDWKNAVQKAEDFFKEMVNKSGNDAVSYETVKSDEKYEAWVILSFNDLSRVEIPQLGLGTWFVDDSSVVEAVKAATKLGYGT